MTTTPAPAPPATVARPTTTVAPQAPAAPTTPAPPTSAPARATKAVIDASPWGALVIDVGALGRATG